MKTGENMSENAFQRPSLTDIAYEEIRKNICFGKYGLGHKLVVDDLVKAFSISNTPIKEALNRLAAEGLVEVLPRRGMQVKTVSEKDVKEICELRLAYEFYCAEKALKVIDTREDTKLILSNTISSFEELIENHLSYDYSSHSKLDQEFHMAIIALSENTMLIREYDRLKVINMSINNYARRELPLERCKEALTEHKAIYEALIKKDAVQLMESIEKHIANVRDNMLSFIK
jgi:GntR family transcriptional regulator, rspAB operon transcriptional repressor